MEYNYEELKKNAIKYGLVPNKELKSDSLHAMLRRMYQIDGGCPCVMEHAQTEHTKCPCKTAREYLKSGETCHCGMFTKE